MIRVDAQSEADLRWFADREYEGDMGKRSTSGGILDAIERGAMIHFEREGDIDQRAMDAAGRLKRISSRLSCCNPAQVKILLCAFKRRDPTGLLSYELAPPPVDLPAGYENPVSLCGAVLGSVVARARCENAIGISLHGMASIHRDADPRLIHWLKTRPREAAGTFDRALKPREKQQAKRDAWRDLEAIRNETERELTEALSAFGALIDGVVVPTTVSLREISRRTGHDEPAVKDLLIAAGVTIPKARVTKTGRSCLISLRQLRSRCPAIAMRLVG